MSKRDVGRGSASPEGDDDLQVVAKHSSFGAEEMFRYRKSGEEDQSFEALVEGVPKATASPEDEISPVEPDPAPPPPGPAATEPKKLALPLPAGVPGAKTSAAARTSGQAPRVIEAIPAKLFDGSQAAPKGKDLTKILAAGAAAIAVIGLGWAIKVKFFPSGPPPPLPIQLTVSSTVPGATIWLDGSMTQFVTPHQFDGVGTTVLVSVQKTGFKSVPADKVLSMHPGENAEVSFELKMVRTVKVETAPPGAQVFLNGEELKGTSPLELPPLEVGTHAKIEVDRDDYLRAKTELDIKEDAPPTIALTLTRARKLDVSSEPDGAQVYMDGEPVGKTPINALKIPENNKFKLKLEKPGFKTWTKLINPRQQHAPIAVDLEEEGLLGLNLNAHERATAVRHVAAVKRARANAARAKEALRKAEAQLEKVFNSPQVMYAERAAYARSVEVAKTNAERAEDEVTDAEQNAEAFRSEVMARIESEAKK